MRAPRDPRRPARQGRSFTCNPGVWRAARPGRRRGRLGLLAYLIAEGGAAARRNGFPNLVLVLHGDGVTIELTGAVYVSAKNVTSVSFEVLPEIPIRRLDLRLPEGKRSLLAAGMVLFGQERVRRLGELVRLAGLPRLVLGVIFAAVAHEGLMSCSSALS